MLTKQDVFQKSLEWESKEAKYIVEQATSLYGDKLVLACSLSVEDIVIIDLLCQVTNPVMAFFLDTDFHFPQTLETKDKILDRYPQLCLEIVKPKLTVEEQNTLYGVNLFESNPNQCCQIRKVEPLNRILSSYQAWITGMRREQANTRANIDVVQWDTRREMVKFNPLAGWTHKQVWAYIVEHQLPYNPLHDQGYPSIGCSPITCTAPVAEGADPRAGRWAGKGKIECGLHT